MCTLWEMAATIRAEEAQKQTAICVNSTPLRVIAKNPDIAPAIDLRESMDYWCESLGATRRQIYRAVAHVGPDPSAIQRFLKSRFIREKLPA